MRNHRLRAVAVAVLLSALGEGVVRAGTIDLASASKMIQGTSVDTDLFLLTQFVGFQPDQAFNLMSSSNATGWAESVTGTYSGTGLNVGYAGNLSGLPSVMWSSTGFFGARSLERQREHLFSNVTASSFDLTFNSTLTVGSNTGTTSLMIPGTIDTSMHPTESDFLENQVTGSYTINGVKFDSLQPSLSIQDLKVLTDIKFFGKVIIKDEVAVTLGTAPSFTTIGTLTSATRTHQPDAAGLGIVLCWLCGCGAAAWKGKDR